MALTAERASEYRRMADRLRGLAQAAQFPEVRIELLWMAQSYERLAEAPVLSRVVDGHRVLELADGASQPTDKSASP